MSARTSSTWLYDVMIRPRQVDTLVYQRLLFVRQHLKTYGRQARVRPTRSLRRGDPVATLSNRRKAQRAEENN
jgi:hypothetical protein